MIISHRARPEVVIIQGEYGLWAREIEELSTLLGNQVLLLQCAVSDFSRWSGDFSSQIFIVFEDAEVQLSLEKIMRWMPSAPVIVLSRARTVDAAIFFMRQGARDYLELPAQANRLLEVIQRELLSQKSLQEHLYQDEGTQLFNLRYLWIYLNELIQESAQRSESFGVIFLDLDQFKRINDSYGHTQGTEVICELGGVIKQCLRGSDRVFRYGGDEFVVILTQLNLQQVKHVAERIRRRIEGHDFLKAQGLKVSLQVSLGISMYPLQGCSGLELIEAADQAMYRDKRERRFTSESLASERGISHGAGKVAPTSV